MNSGDRLVSDGVIQWKLEIYLYITVWFSQEKKRWKVYSEYFSLRQTFIRIIAHIFFFFNLSGVIIVVVIRGM